ncbi:Calcium-binding EF-hand [Corchorus capsularis]|uniref:Calcium-binding EF-hand n=1 Tax=Corchorus capsularis TaxID=210143 RepID=A0A1R3KWU1_COCAP|nr:Calcium-binding EF-hand [Corchorus capsularis]
MANPLGTVEQMKQVFQKYDKNGDGKISREELISIMAALDSPPTPEEVDRMMSEMDKDGNGYVDLDEFLAFQANGNSDDGSQCGEKELKDAFDLYDMDKNGLISVTELHAMLKRLGEKCSLSDCKRMIKQVDKDGDGNVNFEEFKKMMKATN